MQNFNRLISFSVVCTYCVRIQAPFINYCEMPIISSNKKLHYLFYCNNNFNLYSASFWQTKSKSDLEVCMQIFLNCSLLGNTVSVFSCRNSNTDNNSSCNSCVKTNFELRNCTCHHQCFFFEGGGARAFERLTWTLLWFLGLWDQEI